MKLPDHNIIEDLSKTGCPLLNSARNVRVLIRDSKKSEENCTWPTEIIKIKSADLSKYGEEFSKKLQTVRSNCNEEANA